MVEFFTEEAQKRDGISVGWIGNFWMTVLRMKNRALMAPEYRFMGFPDNETVKSKLQHVIREWKPEKVIVNHGENLTEGGRESVREILQICWSQILGKAPTVRTPSQQETAGTSL